jgi:hypothetical protein
MIIHLINSANIPIKNRKAFKMKNYDAWEFKVTKFKDRVCYIVDSIDHLVLVYYVGTTFTLILLSMANNDD